LDDFVGVGRGILQNLLWKTVGPNDNVDVGLAEVMFEILYVLAKFPPYGWVHYVTHQLNPLRLPVGEGGKQVVDACT